MPASHGAFNMGSPDGYSQTEKSIKVILYFCETELEKVTKVLCDLKIQDREDIVLIDAGRDNKTSGSKT